MTASPIFASRRPVSPAGRNTAPERATWVAGAFNAVRTIAAFVVAAAMLLHLILAAPLAMRMLPSYRSAGWPAALCATRSADGATDPSRVPGPPISPHDHYNCAVCQIHGLPLAILAAAMLLLVATADWRRWLWATVSASAPCRSFRLYSSRAPPVLA